MDWGWKRALKREHTELLGLDVGSSQVKLIQLRKRNTRYAVTAAGILDTAAGTEIDGNNKETDTAGAIREYVGSTGISTRLAVCSVSGPEVAVRHFKFPSLPAEEAQGAILLEASQVCPFNVDDSAVDYQLIPDGDDTMQGVLVAATNKLLNTKTKLIENALLKCVLVDVDGLALLNCFNGFNHEKGQADGTTAILSVGNSYATLAIMGNNALPFIRDIAYAGSGIVEQIAAENALSAETVRELLSGRQNQGEPEIELRDSLATACRKLIVDVSETLRYYATQEKSTIVEKIFVCGGFALVKGFVELLDSRLPARAVLWNPFDKIRCDAGPAAEDILAKQGPAMAIAAGLAMRSI